MAPNKYRSPNKVEPKEANCSSEVGEQLPTKAIEAIKTELEQNSVQPVEAPPSDSAQDMVTNENSKRKSGGRRSVCAMHKVVAKQASGKKFKVRYDDRGIPVGRTRALLQSYIGMRARHMIPINDSSWPKVDHELKKKLWQDIQNTFIISPNSEDFVLKSAGVKWRQFKADLTRKHVLPFVGQKKKLLRPPKQYSFVGKVAWKKFVAERTADNWKLLHKEQSQRVMKRKYPHRLSRKGYIGLKEEEIKSGNLERGEEPDRAILWKKARIPKGCAMDEEQVAINEKIDTLLDKKLNGEFKESGSCDVLTAALETPEHSGRVRAVGGFITPKAYFNLPREKRNLVTKAELLARENHLSEELEKMKLEISQMKELITNQVKPYTKENDLKQVDTKRLVLEKDDECDPDPQTENKSCIKVSISQCIRLADEYRVLPRNRSAKKGMLEVQKLIVHAIEQAANDLEKLDAEPMLLAEDSLQSSKASEYSLEKVNSFGELLGSDAECMPCSSNEGEDCCQGPSAMDAEALTEEGGKEGHPCYGTTMSNIASEKELEVVPHSTSSATSMRSASAVCASPSISHLTPRSLPTKTAGFFKELADMLQGDKFDQVLPPQVQLNEQIISDYELVLKIGMSRDLRELCKDSRYLEFIEVLNGLLACRRIPSNLHQGFLSLRHDLPVLATRVLELNMKVRHGMTQKLNRCIMKELTGCMDRYHACEHKLLKLEQEKESETGRQNDSIDAEISRLTVEAEELLKACAAKSHELSSLDVGDGGHDSDYERSLEELIKLENGWRQRVATLKF